MINKIERIYNIGNFENYDAGGNVALGKMSFIYAINGAGKTTLARILQSLSTGDGNIIARHKRIGAAGDPSVIMTTSTDRFKFKNGSWDARKPEIVVFDSHFVANNVYSGFEITNDQQKRLYQFVVGDTGVELIRKIERAKILIENLKWQKDQKEAEIQRLSNGVDAATVCKMKPLANIDELITQKEKDLNVAKNQEKIRKQARPQVIVPNMIAFNVDNVKTVLATDVKGISHEYLEMVKQHLDHLKEEGVEAPTKWVENGMYGMDNNLCPFCGQSLDEVELIKGYNQYFSDHYKEAVKNVDAVKREFRGINIDAYLQKLESDYKAIVTAMEFWKSLITMEDSLPDLKVDDETLKEKYAILKTVIAEKSADPVSAVDNKSVDEFTAVLQTIAERVKAVNDYVSAYVKKIEELCANIGDATEVQKAYDKLVLNKKRFEEPLVDLCNYYSILGKRLSKVKGYNATYQQQQRETSNALFTQYGAKINYYLKDVFKTPFKIESIWSGSYAGRQKEPKLEYVLTYNGTQIELTGESNKAFKNVLSEGDKNTIAFSFFLAKLTDDPHYTDKIVVFDDPLTSLDMNRRTATIEQLVKLYGDCKQVIVLSHNLHFLVDLNTGKRIKGSDKKGLQIVNRNGNSSIEEYIIKSEWIDRYKKAIIAMTDFVANPDPAKQDEAVNSIRISLETFLKLKFCQYIPDFNLTFGKLIDRLKNTPCVFVNPDKNGVITKLMDLDEMSWKTHHGTVDEMDVYHEVDLTPAEAKNYVQDTLDMLEKEL